MRAFPWDNAMKFGLGVMGLAPSEFWAMTPRELSAAYDAIAQNTQGNVSFAAHELEGLMAKFPDKENWK